jgi:P-type conjugative transfer protein TrbJ
MTRKGEGDSMKKLKMSIAVSLALVCGGVPVLSDAGTLTGGATMPEQIVQEGTAIEQLMKQAEAVQLQIQQVTDAAQNLEQVPNQMWQPAAQDLNQLAQIESQAQGLSMAGQNISAHLHSSTHNIVLLQLLPSGSISSGRKTC